MTTQTTLARDASVFRALCTKTGWQTYSPQMMRVLWASTTLQILYGYLDELHKVAATDFTPTDLREYIYGIVRDETKLSEIGGLLDNIEAAPAVSGDVLREAVNQFVSRQLAMEAARSIVQGHMKPDFDLRESLDLLQQATEIVAVDKTTEVVDYLESGMPSLELDRPNRCSLCLSPRLDRALGGGAASGEFVVLLSGPKKGKTSVLARIGCGNALEGKRVLDITLEVSKELRMRRYDSALTGLDYDGLCLNPHVVKSARKRIADAGGSVMFVDWQYEEHSPSDLLPLVKHYGPFDILVLDYLELMIPDKTKAFSRKEQRHLFSKLGKDIRGVAKQLGIPVVTAWQVNRQGAGADMVTEYDISECWDIIKHADAILGISRSDEEKAQKILRIHTILQRLSEKRVSVSFRADLEKNQLEEME